MITAARLKTRTVKDLAAMAKRKKVSGWHPMRKDELVRALVKLAKAQASKTSKGRKSGTKKGAAAKAASNGPQSKSGRGKQPQKKVSC